MNRQRVKNRILGPYALVGFDRDTETSTEIRRYCSMHRACIAAKARTCFGDGEHAYFVTYWDERPDIGDSVSGFLPDWLRR